MKVQNAQLVWVVSAFALSFAATTGMLLGFSALLGESDADDGPAEQVAEATAEPSSTEPEPSKVIVELQSKGRGFLFNVDDEVCSTYSFVDEMNGVPSEPLVIELEDADGSALGSNSIEGDGGRWTEDGCSWSVEFSEVPVDERYRVTVRNSKGEVSGIGDGPSFTLDVSNPS